MPAAEVPGRIDEILGLVGLGGKRGSMVKGLSRGMRQRLGLGRALIAGPKMRMGEPYLEAEDIPRCQAASERGGMEALIAAVPDSYVDGMTATGTPDEVRARVQRYRDVGVDLPCSAPPPPTRPTA